MIGGFFRRGHLITVCKINSQAKTPVSSTVINRTESRLKAAIKSNEAWSWGSPKWGKDRNGLEYRITLPSLVVVLRWTQVNFRFKNGSAIINSPLGLKFTSTGTGRLGSVFWWTHPGKHTITESILILVKWERIRFPTVNPGNVKTIPNQLLDKHGNSVSKLRIGSASDSNRVSLTWDMPKRKSGDLNRPGGKIMEEANAKVNPSDTQNRVNSVRPYMRTASSGLLLNSRCLMKAHVKNFGYSHNVRDLQTQFGVRQLSTSAPQSLQAMKDEVESKQKELMELARLKGIYDPTVLKMQLLLSRSKLFREYAAKLISVKPGSRTAGVDQEKFNKEDEMSIPNLVEYLREQIYHPNKYRAAAVKRVWIPKPGKSEQRPLGIPTVKDRALQALVNLVLLPLVELTSDPNSYGFRPYRDCKMAIAAVRVQLRTTDANKVEQSINKRYNKGNTRSATYLKANQDKWILDADIKGFFNNISHKWLLDNLCLQQDLKKIVEQWLKAKIFDEGTYVDPLSGTPQGGIISPTLANFTLNGLEKAVNKSIECLTRSKDQRMVIKLADGKKSRIALAVSVVRYADDFVVIARSQNVLNRYITPAINEFLKERGLWLSPEKTKLFKMSQEGASLNFLGYTLKYRENWSPKKTIVYSKGVRAAIAVYPIRENVIAFIRKLKDIFTKSQNDTAMELINKLNPVIRGWANYYNLENSSHYRSVVREALYRMTWEWMRKKHPTLGKKALAERYFIRKDETKTEISIDQDSPILNKNSDLEYLKFKNHKWTLYGKSNEDSRYRNEKVQRVAFLLNPINTFPILPAVKYLLPVEMRDINAFEEKISKIIMFKLRLSLSTTPKTPTLKEKLFKLQKGQCAMCEKPIDFDYLHFNSVHIHHKSPIKKGGDKFALKNMALAHSWCHREHKH